MQRPGAVVSLVGMLNYRQAAAHELMRKLHALLIFAD